MPQNHEDTGRGYRHPEKIRVEIANLPPLESEEFWVRAEATKEDSENQLAEETLVYCLRQFLARGAPQSAKRVAELLLPRCAPVIRNQAVKWSLTSQADYNDLRQEVHCQLWEELCNPTERFWEVRFYCALKYLCFDAAKRLSQMREGEYPWPNYVDDEGDLRDVEIEDPDLIEPDEHLFVEEALGQLEEPIRTAVYLRFQSTCVSLRGGRFTAKTPRQ